MIDRDFEAELASLELDDSELHGGLDTSVASSQLTDFLVQHGVLSPSRASSREQLAALSSSSSSSASSSPASSPPSSPYRAPAAAAASTTTSRGSTNASTPERRNLATRLHAAGLSGYDPHTAPSFHSRGGHKDEEENYHNQTPRSGVSSLGLASPPRHPYQPIMQGTGGEALPPPRRPLDTPAAAPPAAAVPTPPLPFSSSSSSSSWEMVNRLLRQEGYRTVSGGEEPREVLGVLRQVLRDRRELGELLKTYQMERQRRDNEVRMVEGRLEGVERAKGSLNETLQAAEDRVKYLEGKVEKARREGGEGVREQKGKNVQLLAKLKQSEHRVRQREAHIDKMNSKLEAMVAREAKEREHQKAILRRLQQREPRPSDGGKLMEVVGALESARQRAIEEIKGLKEEVGLLNNLVKEKENYIQRNEGGGGGVWLASPEGKKQQPKKKTTRFAASVPVPAAAAAVGGGGGAGMQQLLEQVQKLERALRHATKREQTLKEKLGGMEEERKGLREEGERLKEENGKLKAELKGRPTLKAWKANQKQVEELEARLKKVHQEARDATTTAASTHAMRLRSSTSTSSNSTTTNNHKKLLDDICTLLSLPKDTSSSSSSLPLLLLSIQKLTEAMSLLPPLESFVREVCFFLARASLPHGQHLSPDQALQKMPMAEAMNVLRKWGKERVEGGREEGQRFRSRVRTILSTRVAQGGEGGREDEEEEGEDDVLLGKVAGLVQFEQEVLVGREGEEAVEGYLRTRPDILVNRIVLHFRQLFGVKSLEGVFPKMNELYLFSSEMGVFTRVLKSMLRLPLMCPNNTLLTALQKAVRKARGRKGTGGRTGGRKDKGVVDVLEGVPEEGEEEEEEEEEGREEGVVEEEESVLVDGGDGQGNDDEEEEEEEEAEEGEEESSVSDTSFLLSESRRASRAKASYLPQYDDSSMLSGVASGVEEEEEEDEEDTSILSSATSASSASSASTSSSLSSSSAPFTRTRPAPTGGEREREADVSGVSTSMSSNAADQSSISNVDFRLLGVLSAAESRSRDSPFPAPKGRGARPLAPPSPSSSSSSSSSSSVASSSVSSSTSWTRPLPGGGRTAVSSTTSRRTGFGGSSSGGSAMLRGFSSSAASTGTGLLGVLSFAESGDVGAFPTPAKPEDVRRSSSRSSFSSSM